MADEVSLVISTFPDAETAHRIATELVSNGIAACANILPAIRSIYRWQGKLEDATETMVFFKTTTARFADFERKLRQLHPYDVPEIIAVPIDAGSADYLRWVAQSCGG